MATSTSTAILDYDYQYKVNTNGSNNAFTPVNRSVVQTYGVTKGGPVPRWRQTIAAGDNATTTLNGGKIVYTARPCNLKHWQQHRSFSPPLGRTDVSLEGYLIYLGYFSNPTLGASESSANNQALTRYYSNVKSVETKFQSLVFSGELRESLNMIRSPAKAFRRGLSDYLSTVKRRCRKVDYPKRAAVAGETWLEYAFGWQPLINDIDNAIEAFYNSDLVRPIFQMVKGTGKHVVVVPGSGDDLDVGAGYRFSWSEQRTEEVFVKYFGIYDSRGNGTSNLHTAGFRPAEFVTTDWELIPYSFLVDYFTNIGEIVSSWSYRWIQTRWTAKTTRREFKVEALNPKMRYTGDTSTYSHGQDVGEPGSCSLSYQSVNRTPNVSPELPSLELQVPGFGSLKWANLAALAVSHKSAVRAISDATRHRRVDTV